MASKAGSRGEKGRIRPLTRAINGQVGDMAKQTDLRKGKPRRKGAPKGQQKRAARPAARQTMAELGVPGGGAAGAGEKRPGGGGGGAGAPGDDQRVGGGGDFRALRAAVAERRRCGTRSTGWAT